MPLPRELPRQPDERVLRQLVATLIFEGIVSVRQTAGKGELVFDWSQGQGDNRRDFRCRGVIGAFGRPRLFSGSVEMRARHAPWAPATLEALVADLPGPIVNRQRLLDELQLTIAFCRLNDETLTPRRRRRMLLAELEGALEEGHPYHPCFKARTGFSAADHQNYGPESGSAFQLVWLLVSRRHIRQALPVNEPDFWLNELGADVWSQLQHKRDELGLQAAEFGFLPLHPWQWKDLRTSLLTPWIEAGDAWFLGPMGDSYTATQSIRTLMNHSRPMAANIKLPMNLVNTSSRRILEPHSVCTAPAISEWIGGIIAQDSLFRSRYPLTILREYAGIIADGEGDLAGQVGAIWRQSAEATLLPGEAIVPFNALMMMEHDGRPFVDDWVQTHGLMSWFNRLIEITVLPVWHLLVFHGIAVEAHGQNMLLVHRDGWPVRLVLRDFHESIEFSPSFLREPDLMPDFASLHPEYRDAEPDQFYWTDNLDSLRELVMDTLFVYTMSEISHLLDESYSLPESLFWQRVDACLASYAEENGMAERQSLLGHSSPRILTESLMTRKLFAELPEYHHLAPNALAGHAAQLREKAMIRIDDRLYDRAYFEESSARFARQAGLTEGQGTRYAVCFPETADWLSLFFAMRKAAASVLPIHPGTPLPAARKLAIGAGCTQLFYNSLTPEVLQSTEQRDSEGQLLQMSSGTTGAAKSVARSWAQIDLEVETYVQTFREPEGMTPVIACPTTHSYGLICGILVALQRGQKPVIVNTANPKYLLGKLRDIERPLLYSSPAILHTLARLMPSGEQIHAVMTSGTLLPDPWFAQIRAASRFMFQQYGCSESGCIAINPDITSAGDMGFVLPHLRARAGRSRDEADEIVVSSDPGAAIHTRDLGYLRDDGMLVFLSRMDDMINVSGLNVYPGDVEDAVMAMPGVTDAVAFRKSDRFAGERVALLFSASETLAPQTVREWCAANLASHQLPMEILQVDAVPRQANGKISRREIAPRHAAGEFRKMEAAE